MQEAQLRLDINSEHGEGGHFQDEVKLGGQQMGPPLTTTLGPRGHGLPP